MRAACLVLALACILAGDASAQQRSRLVVAKPQPPAASPLRGPLAPTPPNAPQAGGAAARPPAGAAPAPLTAPLFDRGAERLCRSACDRGYYQCLASDDGDSCSTSWGQCRSRCERRRS